tara:strand:- start:282 stop:473 length:192 start_codon:yes stop_codon:yes gene_type:complete
MNEMGKLVILSGMIGIGTSSGFLIGNMLHPYSNDWKDLAAISVLSAIVSTHYAFARVQNMYRF